MRFRTFRRALMSFFAVRSLVLPVFCVFVLVSGSSTQTNYVLFLLTLLTACSQTCVLPHILMIYYLFIFCSLFSYVF